MKGREKEGFGERLLVPGPCGAQLSAALVKGPWRDLAKIPTLLPCPHTCNPEQHMHVRCLIRVLGE